MSHTRLLSRSLIFALISTGMGHTIWPQTPGQESWAGPFNWESIISVYNTGGTLRCTPNFPVPTMPGGGNQEFEFSHAAVMPTGNFAGWVLLWRKEILIPELETTPCDTRCTQNTSVVWAFNPANPAGLIRIEQPPSAPDLTSNLFCGGLSWDRLGQLVIAGGTPGDIDGDPGACEGDEEIIFPAETYRFRPNALAYTQVQPGGQLEMKYSKPPFKEQGVMAIERYYPSVIPLIHRVSEQPNHVGGPGVLMEGGLNLVVGGPPFLHVEDPPGSGQLVASPQGNEFWEVLKADNSSSVLWEDPFVPEDPSGMDPEYTVPDDRNAPHWDSTITNYESYDRKPDHPDPLFPDRVFDSYPRMFQMTGGDILVCGDVDTSADYSLGDLGVTWIIKPQYDNDNDPGGWVLTNGKQGTLPGGVTWHHGFYDTALLFQGTVDGETEYRVLMFGGSRYEAGPDKWVVQDEVWEFSPADSSNPLVDGTWFRKADLIADPAILPVFADTTPYLQSFKRLYGNAVILPTGQVFIVGGTSEDDWEAEGHREGATIPERPIIYDIGVDENDPGTVYEQSENPEPTSGPRPLARLYHSTAVLLADGRVLVAGGKRKTGNSQGASPGQLGINDPRYSGEIFSPPYLDLVGNGFVSRPVITDAPNTMTMSDGGMMETYVFEATRSSSRSFDKVVLLRPGAVTHHSDNDQRYVELNKHPDVVLNPGQAEALVEITVDVPDRNDLPPGYYMLFVIESDGINMEGHRVPSVGKFVRLQP